MGGLIFRCKVCPSAFCEDHLPIEAELIGHSARFEALGMRHPDQVTRDLVLWNDIVCARLI